MAQGLFSTQERTFHKSIALADGASGPGTQANIHSLVEEPQSLSSCPGTVGYAAFWKASVS